VIRENEVEKEKRMQIKEKERQYAVKLQEDYIKEQDRKD
jgi:hypothetical protein